MPKVKKVRSRKIYNPKTKKFIKNNSSARKRIKNQRGKVKNVVLNASKGKVAKQNVIKNTRRVNSQMKAQLLERDVKLQILKRENRKKDRIIVIKPQRNAPLIPNIKNPTVNKIPWSIAINPVETTVEYVIFLNSSINFSAFFLLKGISCFPSFEKVFSPTSI